MKIHVVDNRVPRQERFKNLPGGAVFESRGTFWIKAHWLGEGYAVSTENGVLDRFDPDWLVQPVKSAILEIE